MRETEPSRTRVIGTSTPAEPVPQILDRKSTRLNSSHDQISYAVFCLKKKRETIRVGLRDGFPRGRGAICVSVAHEGVETVCLPCCLVARFVPHRWASSVGASVLRRGL